jgi:invasion protein IalB
VADGIGQRASMQVDQWPFVSTTICSGGECSFEQGRSNDLVQAMLRGSQVTVQLSTTDDGMVGPLTNTLNGFAAQYQRAVQAQQGR